MLSAGCEEERKPFEETPSFVSAHKEENANLMERHAATDALQKSEDVGNNIVSLIPQGWRMLEKTKGEPVKAEGDLNRDGIPDMAAVIEKKTKHKNEAPPRALMIAFGQQDHTFALSIMAEHAILKEDEGGVWGDPFSELSIDDGVVIVRHYGGSNWRWYNTCRFQYRKNDWYLIGATRGSYFTGTATIEDADEEEINFLSGDYVRKKNG